jgi:Family of unknown function (DUF6459)
MTATMEAPTGLAVPTLRRSPVPLRDPVPARRVLDRNESRVVDATQGTLTLVSALPPAAPEFDVQPEPATPSAPPEDREWVARFVQAATEVASGLRSSSQLIRWTTPEIHAGIHRRHALASRVRGAGLYRAGKPVVRSLRMQVVRRGVYEVAAVVADLDRFRAVALRVERFDGRWRVTALEVG